MERSVVHISTLEQPLEIGSYVFTLGSCFSTVLGEKLEDIEIPVANNVLGTVFNPLSILNLLEEIALGKAHETRHLLENDGLYRSLDWHSYFWGTTKTDLEKKLAESKRRALDFLHSSHYAIITLGTSWVYTYNSTGKVVSNCQKHPSALFTKTLLSHKEITSSLERIIQILRKIRPQLHVIFTISPVRHFKDGLQENLLSKSLLRVSLQEFMEEKNIHYFPAYEILLDELRDYSWYADDLLHPNKKAESYIWNRFLQSCCSAEFQAHEKMWTSIKTSLNHKPSSPLASSYKKQMEILQEKIENYPFPVPTKKFRQQVENILARLQTNTLE